jgi:formylglycine-generating enzyme required for sulfatase activity
MSADGGTLVFHSDRPGGYGSFDLWMCTRVPRAKTASSSGSPSPAYLPERDGTAVPPPAVAPFDATKAREHQEAWAKHLGVPVEITNSIGMKFVLIPPGRFLMGSTQTEIDRVLNAVRRSKAKRWYADQLSSETPQHEVALSDLFYLGAHEVTVGQFRKFVEATGYRTEAEADGKGGFGYDASGTWRQGPEFTWRSPGFPQDDASPVVQVSWKDAGAFCY